MTEERIRELLALDPIELLAREYREWTGENMPRAMYVALVDENGNQVLFGGTRYKVLAGKVQNYKG